MSDTTFVAGDLVTTTWKRARNPKTTITTWGADYVVVGRSWMEKGDWVGDGTDAKYPDFECVPLVQVMAGDSLSDFMKFWGDKVEIVFADVADVDALRVTS